MKIAFSTIYGSLYIKDKLFDPTACSIGENLLMPNIMLKKKLEALGNECHTIDLYKVKEIDRLLFLDIPCDSLLTIRRFTDLLKYLLKAKWRKDYLLKAVLFLPKRKRVLQINEPPSVAPISYTKRLHKLFHTVLTWDDDLAAEGGQYTKFYIPQFLPPPIREIPFREKRFAVMIAGSKTSPHINELYSERRRVIEFFEERSDIFHLYGFGWESENFKNYKGTVKQKLATLAKYKFCFCFENIKGLNGYITEKIFDCFFAGCVPIYWGADNVSDYFPQNAFIDIRRFASLEDCFHFIQNIDESSYGKYIECANAYLKSEQFQHTFSANAYVVQMAKILSE